MRMLITSLSLSSQLCALAVEPVYTLPTFGLRVLWPRGRVLGQRHERRGVLVKLTKLHSVWVRLTAAILKVVFCSAEVQPQSSGVSRIKGYVVDDRCPFGLSIPEEWYRNLVNFAPLHEGVVYADGGFTYTAVLRCISISRGLERECAPPH